MTLCDKQKEALKLNPEFMMYPKIDITEAEVEIEKGCMKARYFLMNDENNTTVDNGNNNTTNTSTNDDSFKVLDYDNQIANYANIRATEIPTCQRIFPPKPTTLRKETIMQNVKDKMLNKVQEYKDKHCNKKGWIKIKNIKKEEEEG